jgi:hypothetical protein
VKKHTSILLDVDLVREVAELLGTDSISDTIHAVLEERREREAAAKADEGDERT